MLASNRPGHLFQGQGLNIDNARDPAPISDSGVLITHNNVIAEKANIVGNVIIDSIQANRALRAIKLRDLAIEGYIITRGAFELCTMENVTAQGWYHDPLEANNIESYWDKGGLRDSYFHGGENYGIYLRLKYSQNLMVENVSIEHQATAAVRVEGEARSMQFHNLYTEGSGQGNPVVDDISFGALNGRRPDSVAFYGGHLSWGLHSEHISYSVNWTNVRRPRKYGAPVWGRPERGLGMVSQLRRAVKLG